jgi:uncharacterized repeat protein (TIGR04076 family)
MKDMYEVKITVLKRFHPQEVFEVSPVTPVEPMKTCELLQEGDTYTSSGGTMPREFPCTSAWIALYPYVRAISFGGTMPWLEEEGVSITCCPDGLRPVVFKIERLD